MYKFYQQFHLFNFYIMFACQQLNIYTSRSFKYKTKSGFQHQMINILRGNIKDKFGVYEKGRKSVFLVS